MLLLSILWYPIEPLSFEQSIGHPSTCFLFKSGIAKMNISATMGFFSLSFSPVPEMNGVLSRQPYTWKKLTEVHSEIVENQRRNAYNSWPR